MQVTCSSSRILIYQCYFFPNKMCSLVHLKAATLWWFINHDLLNVNIQWRWTHEEWREGNKLFLKTTVLPNLYFIDQFCSTYACLYIYNKHELMWVHEKSIFLQLSALHHTHEKTWKRALHNDEKKLFILRP